MNSLKKRRWSTYLLVSLIALGCALAGCGTQESPTTIEQTDEAAIYAAIIHQIYVYDDTFGGKLQPTTLYIIRWTDDRAGNLMALPSESTLLTETIQSQITASLQELPTEIVWVDAFEDVELDTVGGRVAGNGAIITLGNIYPQNDGSVQVSGSIYVGSLAAGGQTYILEEIDGVWRITGTTGIRWMS